MKKNAKYYSNTFIYTLLITSFLLSPSLGFAEDEIIFEQSNGNNIKIDLNRSQNSDKLYYYNHGSVTITNDDSDTEILFKQTIPQRPKIDPWNLLMQNNKKDYQLIEQRLQAKQNVNQVVFDGNTMLLLGTMQNNIQQVKLALKYNANVHIVNKDGETPLHWAAASGNMEMITTLLSANIKDPLADINKKNKMFRTPLHFAALFTDNSDVVSYLIINQADLNITDNNGQTVAHYAAALRKWNILETLIKRGANIQLKDKNDLSVEDLLIDRVNVDNMIRFYPYMSPNTKKLFSTRLEGYNFNK